MKSSPSVIHNGGDCPPRKGPRAPGRAGFSLIEVLLALVIFTAAAVGLTEAFVNTLTTLDTLNVESDRQGVLRFIRSQILQEPDRDTMEKGGEIQTLDLGKARWDVEIEETEVADLFRVELSIELNPPEAKQSENYTDTLFLLRPTWSDPVDRSKIIAEARDRIESSRQKKGWW